MKIDIIGDIHGEFFTLRALSQTTDADVILQLGDFGQMPKAGYEVNPYRPFDTPVKFIPGNHDDHDWLRGHGIHTSFPANLEYLGRVGCFKLGEWTIAYLGGGYSIDRRFRTEGIDWWSDEEPTKAELEQFSEYRPDIAITHEGPMRVTHSMFGVDFFNDTSKGMDNLLEHVPEFQPKIWLFGHHHPNDMTFFPEGEVDFICLPIFTGNKKEQVFRVEGGNLRTSVSRQWEKIYGERVGSQ